MLSQVSKLIIAVAVSEFSGIIGSIFTAPAIGGWYATLTKSALNPPGWIFGPVWTMLYFLMGVAAFLIWRKGFDRRDVKIALGVFIIQLALNTLWSIIFFGMHNPGAALIEIIFLWLAILAAIFSFSKISKPATWLLAPYIIWVSFAGYLNYSIWDLNSNANGQIACTMEAKLCSDGSYVGRTGPKCEFTPCPKENLIKIFSPQANESISSPLLISGEARGNWFFEASFPVVLVDWDGKIIAQGIATAQSDWMTTEFVPFKVKLKFKNPEFVGDFSKRGALIFRKDNPSGLPQYDDALEMPIVFLQ